MVVRLRNNGVDMIIRSINVFSCYGGLRRRKEKKLAARILEKGVEKEECVFASNSFLYK